MSYKGILWGKDRRKSYVYLYVQVSLHLATLCVWLGHTFSWGSEEQKGVWRQVSTNKKQCLLGRKHFPDGLNCSMRYPASHKLPSKRVTLFCTQRPKAASCVLQFPELIRRGSQAGTHVGMKLTQEASAHRMDGVKALLSVISWQALGSIPVPVRG